jgi:methylated-DNA-[protein]-cysteine S-methyltransferase
MPGTRYPMPEGSASGDIDSPVGTLGVVVTPRGLLRLAFGPVARLADEFEALHRAEPERTKPRLEPETAGGPATASEPAALPGALADHEYGALVIRQLQEYFAGERSRFTVPVDWSLTSGVQRSILRTLYARVQYGATIGYGELALLSGRTVGASRLVGTVMGSNPVAIFVPCHRVVAADGGIGGFGGGLETKRRLLTLEGALQPALF